MSYRQTMPKTHQQFTPVFDVDGKTPLMPTKTQRAIRKVQSGAATPF